MLKFYYQDVYGLSEPKFNEFLQILKVEKLLEIALDEHQLPKVVEIADIEYFRDLLVFFNTQRIAPDEKKMVISSKCEQLLEKIIVAIKEQKLEEEETPKVDINPILKDYSYRNISVGADDLKDAVVQKLCEELVVGKGTELTTVVHYLKLKKLFPAIRLMNIINRINDNKNRK